jgi:Tubulin/FtsZ family, GTPase domain
MYEAARDGPNREIVVENPPDPDLEGLEDLRLGHDVRFVLALVGGAAIHIGREIARRHLRYLETVAINCDPRVQGFEEFDRRIYLGPDSGPETDTGGSTVVGGMLAHAAQPALDRIFEGATFVTVVGSLGGGSGTGAFPYVLGAAARQCEILSAFVIKPFLVEGERRSIADRALARLHFVEEFVAKQQRGCANLQILDNEYLAARQRKLPIRQLDLHWAETIASHIEKAYLLPAEALVAAAAGRPTAARAAINEPTELEPLTVTVSLPTGNPARLEPILPPPAATASLHEAELTFEVEAPPRPPEAMH